MEQKRVRNSSACEVCRKRRGKCSGVAPCTYCAEHNLLCVFSATIKKRGPASKKQKGLFNFTEGNRNCTKNVETMNLTKVDMGEYLNHFFFLPPLNQDGIHNPTTPAHHMMRFVLLSHMSRSFGAIARSEEFISTARQISGQLYDEPSYDSGVAFMLLADICLANGDPRASHYASVAWNHAKVLSRNDWSNIHLQLQSFVMSNMLDASLTPEQKQQQLFSYASQLLDADVLRLILNGAICKESGLLNCLKNLTVEYSIVETMNDLDKLEYLVQNTPPIQKWVLLLFAKMFRTMLHIQQGSFAKASQAARDMVDISNRPEIRHIVKNELFLPVIMPNLATMGSLSKVVVELYHFTQQLETMGGNSDAIFQLKQELSDSQAFQTLYTSSSHSPLQIPTYSPTNPSPPSYSPPSQQQSFLTQPQPQGQQQSPYTSPTHMDIQETVQQVPQTDFAPKTSHSPPPQQLPVARPLNRLHLPIAKQPNMQTPTQQPTLQLTLQQLFLQQGLKPQPPLPTPIPSSTSTTQTPQTLTQIMTHMQPLQPLPLFPIQQILTTSTTSSQEAGETQLGDDDFLWWQQGTEKVDELWSQAIMG